MERDGLACPIHTVMPYRWRVLQVLVQRDGARAVVLRSPIGAVDVKHLEAPSRRGGHGRSRADGLPEPRANVALVAAAARRGEATTSIR